MVPPGFNNPRFSASVTMNNAGLSFMLPPGLPLSYLNKSLPSVEAVVFLSSISGVFPIVSSKCILSPSYLLFALLGCTSKTTHLYQPAKL